MVTNFREHSVDWVFPKGVTLQKDKLLTSSYGGVNEQEGVVYMRPFEAFACFVK